MAQEKLGVGQGAIDIREEGFNGRTGPPLAILRPSFEVVKNARSLPFKWQSQQQTAQLAGLLGWAGGQAGTGRAVTVTARLQVKCRLYIPLLNWLPHRPYRSCLSCPVEGGYEAPSSR